MCEISDNTRSDCDSETSSYDRDSEFSFTEKEFNRDLIKRANSVPITLIFKRYGLNIDENNRKSVCPFFSHKNGRERTPSFFYYPDTNTYYCFGCKIGNTPSDFVSEMEKINKVAAAKKIIEIFSSDIDDSKIIENNYIEKFQIMMDFSNSIRDFIQNNKDEKSFQFIENICKIYDKINSKHELNNEALLSTINTLKQKINIYLQLKNE